MKVSRSAIDGFWKRFMKDSLYRNSLYLIGSTAVVAVFGFFFWILAARFYDTKDVGLVAALVAVSNVVMTLSLLGFDNSFIRYLPKSHYRNNQLNTGFTITAVLSLVVGAVYLIAIRLFVPELQFVTSTLLWSVFFLFFMLVNLLNYLSNFPFVALRITHIILMINTGFGLLRVIALVAFSNYGLTGLLLSHVLATTVAFLVTGYCLAKKADYRLKLLVDFAELRRIMRYTLNSYFSAVFLTLPTYLLPTLVVGQLGAKSSAYYYIVAVIIAALNVIPLATSQSLFAEGVWDWGGLRSHLVKSVKVIAYLMLPATAVLIIGGKLILSLFGKEYATGGYGLLAVLVVAAIPKVFSYLLSTILRIEHKVGIVALIYGLYAGIVLVGSYVGIHAGRGLISVGWSTLAAELVTALLFAGAYASMRRQQLAATH